jgi:hypothetical protein
MDQSQTPTDYKEYFLNKFVNLFQNFVAECINKVTDSDIQADLNKIRQLFDKLNYEKIITKLSSNTKLQEGMAFLVKHNFNSDIVKKLFSTSDKIWTLMPSFHINKIFLALADEDKKYMYEKLHSLHVCSFTYTKVLESMENTTDLSNFNPFESVGKVAENMDINTLFSGVEVKNISAYEMLMESIVNQQMDSKMSNYMENIKEDDVNLAADKLTGVLNSDNFKGTKQTTKILGDMLSKIKNEVINLKNEPSDKVKGKQGVEQLLGIAQKVAGNMMNSIKDNNVNVLDLWDATSSLAKSTTNSDALNIVDKLIRTNIENNLRHAQMANSNQNSQNTPETGTGTGTETSETADNDTKKSRRHRK